MSYHSEPITRNLVGKWQTRQVKKLSKKWDGQEDENGKIIVAEESLQNFVNEWEKISHAEATKEERTQYFRISTPTISLIGMWGVALFMATIIVLPYLEIRPDYWMGLIFVPTAISFAVSFGLRNEYTRSAKHESYIPSFSDSKLALYSLAGTFLGLAVTYLFIGVLFGG